MFTKADYALFKAAFHNNEELVYLVRKVLLQFPLSMEEKKQIKAQITPEIWALLKKRICPDLDADAPMGQLADLRLTLSTDLSKYGVEGMGPLFEAKQLEIDYLEQQFELLKDVDSNLVEVIKLEDLKVLKGKGPYFQYVHTTARNYLLTFIQQMLVLVQALADTPEVSEEQRKEKQKKNSSK